MSDAYSVHEMYVESGFTLLNFVVNYTTTLPHATLTKLLSLVANA